jgi:hypothetical protein
VNIALSRTDESVERQLAIRIARRLELKLAPVTVAAAGVRTAMLFAIRGVARGLSALSDAVSPPVPGRMTADSTCAALAITATLSTRKTVRKSSR